MKKASLVVVAFLTAFALAFSLAGCGNSDEKTIRKGLTDQLKQVKDAKSDFWQKDMKSDLKDLESLGINSDELINAWISGFDYKVGTITINGNKATAEITITCKQFFPAANSAMDKLLADPGLATMSESQMIKKYGELVISELKASKTVTTTFKVNCTKDGNTWSEDASAADEYARALLGADN